MALVALAIAAILKAGQLFTPSMTAQQVPAENFLGDRFSADSDEELFGESGALLRAYTLFALQQVPSVAWKSLIVAMLEQMWNLFFLFCIYSYVYVHDVVFNINDPTTSDMLLVPGSRGATVMALALLCMGAGILLLVVNWVCDCLKQGIASLIAGYHHDQVASSDLTNTQAVLGIPMLVDKGYMTIFPLLKSTGMLCVLSFF